MMGLLGLREYLNTNYDHSIFNTVLESGKPWEFHLHGRRIVSARLIEDLAYDLKLDIEGQGEAMLPKLQVKFLYPAGQAESLRHLVKTDKKVKARGLEPIVSRKDRYFVKNKTLFALMQDRKVVFFTLLEGEIVRGIIAGFSQYEITVHLKGGMPLTIMRHAIYDARDKKGRCFLKAFQEAHRDWQKHELFVA